MSENENMELDETMDMVEQAEVEAEVATTEDADVEAAPADAEVAEDDEVVEAAEGQTAPEDLDDKLFDKVNRAARLLRNRCYGERGCRGADRCSGQEAQEARSADFCR